MEEAYEVEDDFDLEEEFEEPATRPADAGGSMPNNLQAEQALLGGLIFEPEQFDFIEGKVLPEDFFAPTHGMVFAAMQNLRERQQPIDPILLQTELENRGHLNAVGGVSGLNALTDAATSGANVEHYAAIIIDLAARRRYIQACHTGIAAASAPDAKAVDVLGEAEKSIQSIVTRNFSGKVQTIHEVLNETWSIIDAFLREPSRLNGVMTTYTELDEKLTGLHDDELIIIAGRPSMGKTTFGLNIARNVAVNYKQPVAIFTLEMSSTNIASNLLSAQAKVDSIKLRSHHFSAEDMEHLSAATEVLQDAPIYIDETPAISLPELRGKARHLKLRNNIKLIVIDYLQLMTASAVAKNRSREQEVSEVSRGLKALAKELHIPVIALSQLSRKSEARGESKRPMLSDLRESGAIEQDADVVLMLHREDYYNKDKPDYTPTGEAEVIIAKNRNGPTGAVPLIFIGNQLRFENKALQAGYVPSSR